MYVVVIVLAILLVCLSILPGIAYSLENKLVTKKIERDWDERVEALKEFCAGSSSENRTEVLSKHAETINRIAEPYRSISAACTDDSFKKIAYLEKLYNAAVCFEEDVRCASKRIVMICKSESYNKDLDALTCSFRTLPSQSCDTLSSCIRRLYALHNEAWELYNSVLKPLFELGTKAAGPAQEQLLSYVSNLHGFQEQLRCIMDDINQVEKNIVSDICSTAPVPTKSVKQQSTLTNILSGTKKIKSPVVRAKMESLSTKLSVYMEDKANSIAVDGRINSYYLPSLEFALSSLHSAEKKHSKKIVELETLALRAAEVVEEVLDARQDDLDAMMAQRVEVEIKTAESLAALKCDC